MQTSEVNWKQVIILLMSTHVIASSEPEEVTENYICFN